MVTNFNVLFSYLKLLVIISLILYLKICVILAYTGHWVVSWITHLLFKGLRKCNAFPGWHWVALIQIFWCFGVFSQRTIFRLWLKMDDWCVFNIWFGRNTCCRIGWLNRFLRLSSQVIIKTIGLCAHAFTLWIINWNDIKVGPRRSSEFDFEIGIRPAPFVNGIFIGLQRIGTCQVVKNIPVGFVSRILVTQNWTFWNEILHLTLKSRRLNFAFSVFSVGYRHFGWF